MNNEKDSTHLDRRELLGKGVKLAAAGVGLTIASSAIASQPSGTASTSQYAEPAVYGLPRNGIKFDKSKAALVVVDPQIDFLSPKGIGWAVLKDSILENNTVSNLEDLFKNQKKLICLCSFPLIIITHMIINGSLARQVKHLCIALICSTVRDH